MSREKEKVSIATRTGDSGETSLLYGQRVSKAHLQMEACGTLDELSSALGLARAAAPGENRRRALETTQQELIAFMGELAAAPEDLPKYQASRFPSLDTSHLKRLDEAVAKLESAAPPFEGWALPGKNLPSAALEIARTTARRGERRLVALQQSGFPVRPILLQYLNRLSDFLWLLAREAEREE